MNQENLLSKSIVVKELALCLVSVAYELDALNINEIDTSSFSGMLNERMKKRSLILNVECSVYAECAERCEYEFAIRLLNDPTPLAVICLTL